MAAIPVFYASSLTNSGFRSSSEREKDLLKSEEGTQAWIRDFEDSDGFLGSLRTAIHKQKEKKHIPSDGIQIEAKNLSYTSKVLQFRHRTIFSLLLHRLNVFGRIKDRIHPTETKKRKILSNLNFTIKQKTMTLVIGSPGSGKSALCSVLADQGVNGSITGEILMGCEPIRATDHSHRVAYVRDEDIHFPHLTVQETFEFAHALLTPGLDKKFRLKKIETVLRILGLSHRADTIVGDDLTRGVSGGERRRVSIGVELLKRCQLLVLDEATTGLDSTTSLQIFRALRIVADEMAPVFATLKQPGRELLDLFDGVIVLHAGNIVYSGSKADMIAHFENQGYQMDCSINPADEILKLVEEKGDELVERYKNEHDSKNEDIALRASKATKQTTYDRYSQNWIIQFLWGVRRGFQLVKNAPSIPVTRVLFALLMSVIIGTLFLQLGDNQAAVQGLQGALFIVATFPAFQALASLPTVFSTRPVFYYQRRNNYFHAIPMIFAEFVVGLPITIVESFVFSTVCYWLVGFNTIFTRYLYFLVMVMSLEIIFNIITRIAGFLLPSFLIANIVIPPIIFMLNFFTGFAVVESRTPHVVRWLYYASPFRYLLEGLTINEFKGAEFVCDDDELQPPNDSSSLHRSFLSGGFEGNQVCPITTGEQVLLIREYEDSIAYAWYWFLVLQGYILVLLLIMITASYCVYKKKPLRNIEVHHNRRNSQNQTLRRMKRFFENCFGFSTKEDTDIAQRIQTNIPIYLEWKNVSYFVKVLPKKGIMSKLGNFPCFSPFALQDLQLLDSISGYAKPGMLIAFMGASGAGKTTLLDVLAQRKTSGRIEGEILINGAPIDPETLSRFSGYVEQQNIHVLSETVEEALKLSAALRLCYPEGKETPITRHHRAKHVAWVMDILSLTKLRFALVEELSLEQKKRLTIGIELAANPSLLFLDEPTSGLDSIAALRIMKSVRSIAESGVAVICTIHQPSEVLFSIFTHLLLLARGGHVVYFGETGGQYDRTNLFFSQFNLHPDVGQNPADFFLECCSNAEATNPEGQTISEAFLDSDIHKETKDSLENGLVPPYDPPKQGVLSRWLPCLRNRETVEIDKENISPPVFASSHSRSTIVQWIYLACRNGRLWFRSPVSILIFYANAIIFGLLLGFLFSEIDSSQRGAREYTSLFFFTVTPLTTCVMTFIPQIFEERAVLYRELSSKTYRAAVYLSALMSVSLPMIMIYDIIVLLLVYVMTRLVDEFAWYQVGIYLGIGTLVSLVAYVLSIFACSVVADSEIGNALYTSFNLLSWYMNGFLLIRPEIPAYWIWAYWIAYHHYSIEGLFVNGIRRKIFHCEADEIIPVLVPSDLNPFQFQLYCKFEDGYDVIDDLHMHDDWIIVDVLALCGMCLALFTLTCIIITKVKHINR